MLLAVIFSAAAIKQHIHYFSTYSIKKYHASFNKVII